MSSVSSLSGGKRTTPLTIEEILAEPDFFEIEEERAAKFTLADLLQGDEPIDFRLPEVPVGDDEDDEQLKEIMMRADDIKADPLQSLHVETFVCVELTFYIHDVFLLEFGPTFWLSKLFVTDIRHLFKD